MSVCARPWAGAGDSMRYARVQVNKLAQGASAPDLSTRVCVCVCTHMHSVVFCGRE